MRTSGLVLILWSYAAVVGAQTPLQAEKPPANAGAAQPAQPGQPAKPAPPAETYTYESEGRRDPFTTLLGTGSETQLTPKRGEGAGGLTVAEISVRGIVQSRGTLIAMVQGPDKRTFTVHQGDKFVDGTVKTITPQGLIIVQEVNDPLSLVKQREIRKQLRSLEEPK